VKEDLETCNKALVDDEVVFQFVLPRSLRAHLLFKDRCGAIAADGLQKRWQRSRQRLRQNPASQIRSAPPGPTGQKVHPMPLFEVSPI